MIQAVALAALSTRRGRKATAIAVALLVIIPISLVGGIAGSSSMAPAAAAGCGTPGAIDPAVLTAGGRPPWWNTDGKAAERDTNAGVIIAVSRRENLPDRAAVIAVATSLQETKLLNLGVQEPSGSNGLFMQLRAYYPFAISSSPVTATQAFLGPKGTTPGLDPSIPGLLDVPNWESLPLTVAAQKTQRSAFPDAYAQWEQLAIQLVTASQAGGPAGASTTSPSTTSTVAPAAYNPATATLSASDPANAGCAAGTVTGVPSNPGSPFKDGPAAEAAVPRANPRTVQQAISWALQQNQTGTTGWSNRCLSALVYAYGWSSAGILYAIDAYRQMPAQYRHDGDRNPPPGAMLFWTTSGRAGHVALYLGNGMIATTDMPVNDKIGIVPAEWIEQKWRGTYVGWTPPYFPQGG